MQGKEGELPKIIFDSRESKSLVVKELGGKCILEEKVLEIGDYIISDRVACERKTASDFVSSIVDGRLFSQLSVMKSFYSTPVLIIEGDGIYEHNVKPSAIRGAVASIAIDFSIPIIWTRSSLETAEMLVSMAMREQLTDGRSVKTRGGRKPKDIRKMQKYLISSLPCIDSFRAESLLRHFKCPEFVFTASERELAKAEGIGKEIARKIREVVGTDY